MPDVRLIDADSTKEKLGFAIEPFIGSTADEIRNDTLLKAIAIVDSMPTVDAQPVKRGHWIDVDYKTIEHGFIETYPNEGVCCSECRTGFKKSRQLIRNFCPNCGAKMDGDADDGQGKSD